jgi:ectoine hydroxylase-related dioxygenase (phytanoyl-CoA dioxygenase family)
MAEEVEMREITDDELAQYEEDGWVMLRELISRELAAELLTAAQELRETVRSSTDFEPAEHGGRQVRTSDWVAFEASFAETFPSFQARKIRVEPFRSLTFGEAAGRTAHRIMNRGRLTDESIGVRYLEDALLYKPPGEPEVDAFKMGYHQDQPTFGVDRGGGFNLWIAIDEVRPEQGAMRFLTGSHREGSLGPAGGLLARYPKLLDVYDLSPPFHYQPGDATVHNSYTIHGTPPNRADKPRWSYVPTYIPADCEIIEDTGLGLQEADERFPLVYP